MRKFESSQKDESRAQSADFSKAYRTPRGFICVLPHSEEYVAIEVLNLGNSKYVSCHDSTILGIPSKILF